MIFLDSASSAAALVFYLSCVCTRTDTEGEQRKAWVRNILKSLEKTQYLMNTLYIRRKDRIDKEIAAKRTFGQNNLDRQLTNYCKWSNKRKPLTDCWNRKSSQQLAETFHMWIFYWCVFHKGSIRTILSIFSSWHVFLKGKTYKNQNLMDKYIALWDTRYILIISKYIILIMK